MTPKQEAAPPTVADVIREVGITVGELAAAAPDVSRNMWKEIHAGRIPGHSFATSATQALNDLSLEYHGKALRYKEAAAKIDVAYPVPRIRLENGEDRPVLLAVARGDKSLAEIAEEHGKSRQAVWETVTRYEKRTGTKLPRYGRPRRKAQRSQ
jgi:hypothetical protein